MDISVLGVKLSVELLILIGIIYIILFGSTMCGCSKMSFTESFTGANTNNGRSKSYSLTNPSAPINTNAWNLPDMTVIAGQPLTPGVKEILNRPEQQLPLPEGELSMFANTNFKPECCPNTYSNGSGCACMTTGQYNYLVTRGGNNVPFSEY